MVSANIVRKLAVSKARNEFNMVEKEILTAAREGQMECKYELDNNSLCSVIEHQLINQGFNIESTYFNHDTNSWVIHISW